MLEIILSILVFIPTVKLDGSIRFCEDQHILATEFGENDYQNGAVLTYDMKKGGIGQLDFGWKY